MPTVEDFLEIIQAHPDDDVPKLVYADWLDDQGDSRGELIRLLVEVRRDREEHKNWHRFMTCAEKQFGTSGYYDEFVELLDKHQQFLAACQLAESVLEIFERRLPDDDRPRQAIEVARCYFNGKASEDDLKSARSSAFDAAGAAKQAERDPNREINEIIPYFHFGAVTSAALAAYQAATCSSMECARAAVRSSGLADPSHSDQHFLWLVERLLKFKID